MVLELAKARGTLHFYLRVTMEQQALRKRRRNGPARCVTATRAPAGAADFQLVAAEIFSWAKPRVPCPRPSTLATSTIYK